MKKFIIIISVTVILPLATCIFYNIRREAVIVKSLKENEST